MQSGVTHILRFDDRESFAPPQNLPQQLERHIQRDIIRLRLAPGSRLAEEDLCRAYGVSRSPVREALSAIEAAGLAVRRPRRGVHVAPMTIQNLDELYDCRIPLEGRAAFHAAGKRTADQLATMRALLREMDKGQHRRNRARERIFEANIQLTDLLHQAAHSTVLQAQLMLLDRQALRYRYYCYLRDTQIVEDDLAANIRLVDQIEAGDCEAAQQTTQSLVRHGWQVVRGVMHKHDPQGLPATETAQGASENHPFQPNIEFNKRD